MPSFFAVFVDIACDFCGMCPRSDSRWDRLLAVVAKY